MLRLVSNAIELLLAAYREWQAGRIRKAERDAVAAERSRRAVAALEAERKAVAGAEAAGHDSLLDLNDRLRDRAKRN